MYAFLCNIHTPRIHHVYSHITNNKHANNIYIHIHKYYIEMLLFPNLEEEKRQERIVQNKKRRGTTGAGITSN